MTPPCPAPARKVARYEVGDRLLLHSEQSGPVEVIYRGCADGCAVVMINGYQFAVDPQRLYAQSPDDEGDP